jgi:primase-polymerase (primpol)-like protein
LNEDYEAEELPYDGIGLVFCSADPFVDIDPDDCRNPQTGEVELRVRERETNPPLPTGEEEAT